MHIQCSLPLQQIQCTFTANCQCSKYMPHLLLIAISVNTVYTVTANSLDSDAVCTLTPNCHDRYTVCTFLIAITVNAVCTLDIQGAYLLLIVIAVNKVCTVVAYCQYSKCSVHIRYTGCTFTAHCHYIKCSVHIYC